MFSAVSLLTAQSDKSRITTLSAGLNVSNMVIESESGSQKPGFNLGAMRKIQLAPNSPVYFGIGGFFSHQGTKEKVKEASMSSNDVYITTKTTINLNYFKVPVVLCFHIPVSRKFSIQPSVGGYYAFGVYGDAKMTRSVENKKSTEKTNVFSDKILKRSDAGFSLGCAVDFSKFRISLGYDLGILNISKQSKYDINNRVFMVNLGINIFD